MKRREKRLLQLSGSPVITVSAKLRLAIWLTLMVLLLAALVFGGVLFLNRSAMVGDPVQDLVGTVEKAVSSAELEDGAVDWEELSTYSHGVYCAYYDAEGKLMQAALPEELDLSGMEFRDNAIRTERIGGAEYYVYDNFVDLGGTGFWARGLISTTGGNGITHAITVITLSLVPILLILTLAGSWAISWDTFRPMEKILSMADSISSGDDLSARIDLKRGSLEMLRLSQAFDRMFERLERSFNAERQFASDASHELRTPITVILAACDRARRKARTPEQYSDALSTVEEQARSMSSLVQELLSLTRIEHNTGRYLLRDAELSGFVASCCEEFTPADAKGITLQTEITPGLRAKYNPALYSRIMQNLLQNAYRYGRENGQIRVRLYPDGAKTVLEVEDDGVGIAPEDLDKVWQRFWQADPSHSEGGSSGLGLAMVQEIAELHGGKAAVRSEPGKGSVFTVTI